MPDFFKKLPKEMQHKIGFTDQSTDDDYDRVRRNLVISTVEGVSDSFVRWLAGGEDHEENSSYGCAEFCVPHLLVPFVKHILRKKEIPISKGQCSDEGYSTHVLDKTFTALTYSLDVELYAESIQSDDDNNEDEKQAANVWSSHCIDAAS